MRDFARTGTNADFQTTVFATILRHVFCCHLRSTKAVVGLPDRISMTETGHESTKNFEIRIAWIDCSVVVCSSRVIERSSVLSIVSSTRPTNGLPGPTLLLPPGRLWVLAMCYRFKVQQRASGLSLFAHLLSSKLQLRVPLFILLLALLGYPCEMALIVAILVMVPSFKKHDSLVVGLAISMN